MTGGASERVGESAQAAGTAGANAGSASLEAAIERGREACADVRARLVAASVPLEALAGYVAPRRKLLRTKPATMESFGQVWRLGTLLLGEDNRLYAAGHATRAAERGRPGYQSESREERRELAAAALRGGFEVGTPVNFDAVPIELTSEHVAAHDTSSPVGFLDGELRVRWRAGAPLEGGQPLAAYLAERVELLVNPPFAQG